MSFWSFYDVCIWSLIHATGESLDKIISRCSFNLDHLIHFCLKEIKEKIWLFIIRTSKTSCFDSWNSYNGSNNSAERTRRLFFCFFGWSIILIWLIPFLCVTSEWTSNAEPLKAWASASAGSFLRVTIRGDGSGRDVDIWGGTQVLNIPSLSQVWALCRHNSPAPCLSLPYSPSRGSLGREVSPQVVSVTTVTDSGG